MDLSAIKSALERKVGQSDFQVRADETWVIDPFKSFLSKLPDNKRLVLNGAPTLQQHTLTMPCTLGQSNAWTIPGIPRGNVRIDRSTLQFGQLDDGTDEVKVNLEGTLVFGGESIHLSGELWDGNLVRFALPVGPRVVLSLEAMAYFLEYASLQASPLIGAKIFHELSLSTLQLDFGFETDSLTCLTLRADAPPAASWPVIEGLETFPTLSGIGITLDYFFEAPSQRSYYGNIHAAIHIGTPPEPMHIRLPFIDAGNWLIEILPPEGKTLPGLSAFAGMVGGAALQQTLQQGFRHLQFPDVANLTGVYITFDMQHKQLGNARLQARLHVAGVEFEAEIVLPDITVYGYLSAATPIRLKQLFTTCFAADTVTFPEVDLTGLTLRAEPGRGQYALSAEVVINNPQQGAMSTGSLSQKPLQLKRIAFEITKVYAEISGTLDCTCDIEGVEFTAVASRLPSNLGWRFHAGLSDHKGLDLTQWLKKFGVTLPGPLADARIEQLSLAFSTADKDFRFILYGSLHLSSAPSSDITLRLDVEVGQQSGSPVVTFGGSLTAGERQFDLVFHRQGQTNEFVAVYDSPFGDTITLKDFINSISSAAAGAVPASISMSLQHAQFAFQSTAQQSKVLFGVDVGAGVNLSDFSNLPLLGATLPREQTLSLAFQILATNAEFQPADLQGFNRLTPDSTTKLPEGQPLPKGFNLLTNLRLGTSAIPLHHPALTQDATDQLQSTSPAPGGTPSSLPVHNAAVTSATNVRWFKLQKTFGPVHLERVGLGYQTGNIEFLLDGDLTAAGLTLALHGLRATFALSDLAQRELKPTFHLDGIGIDYHNSPVEIGGAFLQQSMQRKEGDRTIDYIGYAGQAVIRTEKLTLSAIGSYAFFNGHPSLYLYAVLNYPLGGPAFFFITGFAAGFGYNRALTIPGLDDMATFPLVAAATKGDAPALPQSGSPAAIAATITTELQKLESYIYPSVGDIFVAAGIKFTTFKHVQSFALLVVKFGQRFEIDLLGLSTMVVPPPESGGGKEPVAHAQLALKATFIPDEGVLSMQGQLTPNSYILSRACHLTGGFAFCSWFKDHPSGAKAGDFVITLGGYHPQFNVPKHYPIVPRLGFQWQVNKPGDAYELLIKGQAYFALTAHALMAGGSLEATWSSGSFRAWFKAGADFLITWQPYHYDASFYIDIGASYTFELFGTNTITADLGADLHIWGPEFAGSATVHLGIISFTVSFGSGAAAAMPPISWPEFKTAFLPAANHMCSINVHKGLLHQITAEKGQVEDWIVNPKEFVCATNTVIPSTAATFAGKPALLPDTARTDLAIAPVGIESNVNATQDITITFTDGTAERDVSGLFEFVPIFKAVPAGLWGKPKLSPDKKYVYPPDVNGERLLDNTLAGFEIKPAKPIREPAHSTWIDPGNLQYATELIPDTYAWQDDFQVTDLRGEAAWNAASQTTGDHPARTTLLQALGW